MQTVYIENPKKTTQKTPNPPRINKCIQQGLRVQGNTKSTLLLYANNERVNKKKNLNAIYNCSRKMHTQIGPVC